MDPAIQERMHELINVCERRHVQRLALFGSAAGQASHDASDLDFLVEFKPVSPVEHADSYFGLKEDLEALFARAVDLVERSPIRNPYFLAAIEQTQVELYAA